MIELSLRDLRTGKPNNIEGSEPMKLTFDSKRGLLYLELKPDDRKSARTDTLVAGVFADCAGDGRRIGIDEFEALDVVGLDPTVEVTIDGVQVP